MSADHGELLVSKPTLSSLASPSRNTFSLSRVGHEIRQTHLIYHYRIRAQQTRPQPLRWLVGNFDAHLKKPNGKLGVGLARNEQPEVNMASRQGLRNKIEENRPDAVEEL